MKRFIERAIAGVVLTSMIVPMAFFAIPPRAEAAAGSAAACAVALGLSTAAQTPGAAQEVVGVPAANIGKFFQGIFTGASVNAKSFQTCILYPLGKIIIIALIRNIGASVVNWVNSGFEGNPSFVTDFEGTLIDAADQAIGTFIEGSDLGFLCNDFGFQIRIALALKHSQPFRERARCTLSDIGENISTNGGRGWDNLLAISTEPQNNVYGAYFIAETELTQRAAKAVGITEKRVAIGEGFLDFETCDRSESPSQQIISDNLARNQQVSNDRTFSSDPFGSATINLDTSLSAGSGDFGLGPKVDLGASTFQIPQTQGQILSSAENTFSQPVTIYQKQPLGTPKGHVCKEKSTKTPGKIISSKLSSVLGQGDIQAAVAQEIDDVIAATMNQLAQKVIQGTFGLLGLSKKRSSSQSYLSKYQSQFYGTNSGSGIPADIGATSEIQDYQIGSYDQVNALLDDTSDPNINAINTLFDKTVDAASQSQQEQIVSVSDAFDSTSNNSSSANISILKPASQSSGTNPSAANDGIMTTSSYSSGSVTSNDDPNPWWQVNLGEIKKIKEVRVWAVSGKPASQTLETFRVVVGGGAGQWSSDLISGAGASNPIIVPVNQSGSTVRIEKIATPYQCSRFEFDEDCYHPLELAEVQVMEDIVINLSNANLAPGTTSNSSTTSGTNTATDTRTGTSTLSWTPASPTTISVSSSRPLDHELKLGAEKTATNLTVEIGLYKNGVRVPFLNVFNDDFDILRGATNGSKSSSQSAITSSTGGIRFKMSVDGNASYSFVLKGTLRPSASSGGYTFQTKVSDSTDTELSDKSQTTSFSL